MRIAEQKGFVVWILRIAVFWLTVNTVCLTAAAKPQASVTGISSETAVWDGTQVISEGFDVPYLLNDGNERTFSDSAGGKITLRNDSGIAGVYVVFQRLPEPWELLEEKTGRTLACGQNRFLHEYVEVEERLGTLPQEVTLVFPQQVSIAEVYAFSRGALPEWVQLWEPPFERADLLLFSAHADDEQLFFAGILPYYAGELGYHVQVVYATNSFDTYDRPHEQLDGLWTVGVKNYPVIADFPDLYSENLDWALEAYQDRGIAYEEFSGFLADMIRRFQPLVVISHDVDGEYGHGTHMLCAKALMDIAELCAKEDYRPQSAKQYGVWQPQKVYLHSYPENRIVMNWDIPLEKFGGKTAFQMSQLGYMCHKSQHVYPGLKNWLCGKNDEITKASEIPDYSPCNFGLYYSVVGSDVSGGDFFENLKTYEQQKEEEKARQKAEEEERRKAEAGQQKKEEEARRKAEEEAKQKAERQRREDQIKQQNRRLKIAGIGVGCVFAASVAAEIVKRKHKRAKKNKKEKN